MTVMLVRADARDLPLADGSVDLIVTSPPYFALRAYQDNGGTYGGQLGAEATPEEFVDGLVAATREMVRVLKASGSLWVNLGDKYARTGGGGDGSSDGTTRRGPQPSSKKGSFRSKSLMGIPWRYAIRCIDQLGLILRAEVIWSKPNGLPESVTDRVRRSHEQWFHFVKEPRYFSAIDTIRDAYATVEPATARRGPSGPNRGIALDRDLTHNPLGKLPGSVWNIATEPLKVPAELGIDHYAAFPTEWPRRIILGWSPPDGTVLDPFCGTGTTVAVAKALGRSAIGTDLSGDYLRLADWRVNGDGYQRIQRKLFGTRPQPPAGQLALQVAP